jgi:hypothetical protein
MLEYRKMWARERLKVLEYQRRWEILRRLGYRRGRERKILRVWGSGGRDNQDPRFANSKKEMPRKFVISYKV